MNEKGIQSGNRRLNVRHGLILLATALSAAPLWAAHPPEARYRTVIERQMFGRIPEGFDPSSPAHARRAATEVSADVEAERKRIMAAIRFSVLNVTPNGETFVGFTDTTDAKASVGYYLRVGESRNGWTVRQADARKATMTLARCDVEVVLPLGGSTSGREAAKPAADLPAKKDVTKETRRHILKRRKQLEKEK